MRFAAVIPARAGSKGIINKNNQILGKWSLTEWAIKVALELSEMLDIFVLTDSVETKSMCLKYPVVCLDRKQEYSGDQALIEELIRDFLQHYSYRDIVLLQPTTPFRKASDIANAINQYKKNNYESVMAVTEPLNHPSDCYYFSQSISEAILPRNQGAGRQSFKRVCFDTGAFYITSGARLKAGKNFISNKTFQYYCDEMAAVDIDNDIDLRIARSYLETYGWDCSA